jgi:hypothetical protein
MKARFSIGGMIDGIAGGFKTLYNERGNFDIILNH